MRDFTFPGNGTLGETISRICETWSVRDFANFRNHGRCPISLDRETDPLVGKRFRLFGKRDRCAISLISDIAYGARFHLPGKRGH